jgi:hypothetical protein
VSDRVIHIGAPKCGSTALQEAFHANRVALRAEGVHYIGQQVHWINAAKAAVGVADRITREVPNRSEWQKLLAEVARVSDGTALISSEWFAGAPDERVRAITADLDPSRLQAVLVIRPLTSTLPSAWQQSLKLGQREGFTQWLEAILRHPDEPRGQRVWGKHRYDQIVQRWGAALGADRLTVIVADENDPAFIFTAFGELLGLSKRALAASTKRTNPSLSAFEADTLAELNRLYFENGGTLTQYRGEVLRTFDGYVNSVRRGTVEKSAIPAQHLEEVRQLNREIAAGIQASGCRVIGDLSRFAEAGTRNATESATTETAAAQRRTDVQSAAGMIYSLMITTGVADPVHAMPGFGKKSLRLRRQAVSLLRRAIRTALLTVRRRGAR